MAVYLLHEREFIKTSENIYKIGKTTEIGLKRFQNYPKDSQLILHIKCINCNIIKNIIKDSFSKIFKCRTDIGIDYFEADIHHIKLEFLKICIKEISTPVSTLKTKLSEKEEKYVYNLLISDKYGDIALCCKFKISIMLLINIEKKYNKMYSKQPNQLFKIKKN